MNHYNRIYLTSVLLFFSLTCCQKVDSAIKKDTITPGKTEKILKKTMSRLNSEFRRYEPMKSQFFLRQTVQEKEQGEVAEAILEACSNITLRDINVLSGRISNEIPDTLTPPYPLPYDLYHSLQVGPMIAREPYWWGTRTPFRFVAPRESSIYGHAEMSFGAFDHQQPVEWYKDEPKFRDKYDIRIEELIQNDGKTVYKTDLRMKEGETLPTAHYGTTQYGLIPMPCILIGTMYIDKEKMQLLRFEGEVKGYTMKVNVGDRAAMVPGECRVKVQYTHQRGFTEVEKSDCIVSCLGCTYNLQLINLGEKKIKGEPSVPVDGDIIHAIRQAGYNSKLMESEAVRSIIAIPHP